MFTGIVVGNQKGGVGKTTICKMLAQLLIKQGKQVLVLDADEQRSLGAAFEMEDVPIEDAPFPILEIAKYEAKQDEILAIARDYDIVILDTPGVYSEKLMSIIGLYFADIVLVPFRLNTQDVGATSKFIELCKREIIPIREEVSRSTSLLGVSCFRKPGAATEYAIPDIEKLLDITMLKSPFSNRIVYERASALYKPIWGSNRVAKQECESILEELSGYIQ